MKKEKSVFEPHQGIFERDIFGQERSTTSKTTVYQQMSAIYLQKSGSTASSTSHFL
jgi:hypothetical protein